MNRIYITIVLHLIVISLVSQNKHLIFESDFVSTSLIKDKNNTSNTSLTTIKGFVNILVFKGNKAIVFNEYSDSFPDIENIIHSNHKSYTLIDLKKNRAKNLNAYFNESKEKVFISTNFYSDWRNIDPYTEPIFDEFTKSIVNKYDSQKWQTPKISFSNEVSHIGRFNCKKAIVIDNNKEYIVWYTEDYKYNNCFEDYRFLIPGTVVIIEHEDKIIFELISIKDTEKTKDKSKDKVLKALLKSF